MKHSGQTVLWELWAALCLCTALVLPPGSPWLHEPALLYPGLSLAAGGPAPVQLLEQAPGFDFATLCDFERPAAVP